MPLGVQITLNFMKTDEHAQVANNFMCINRRYHQIKSVRGTKCKGLQTATQVGVFPLPSAKQITVIMIIKTKCLAYWHWYQQKFYNWLYEATLWTSKNWEKYLYYYKMIIFNVSLKIFRDHVYYRYISAKFVKNQKYCAVAEKG